MPSRLTFKTTDDTEYVTIFKLGDDPRQDQLILQIIRLMDKVKCVFDLPFNFLLIVMLNDVRIIGDSLELLLLFLGNIVV